MHHPFFFHLSNSLTMPFYTILFYSGDVNTISVGKGVTIGDRAMVHCSGVNGDYPCVIGDNVIIGAGAIVHGCTVESGSMIGEGAQVMDGAKVQKNAVVAPGALVSAGKTVPAGQMWGGVPAKMIRELTSAEIASIKTTVAENIEMAKLHSDETAKPSGSDSGCSASGSSCSAPSATPTESASTACAPQCPSSEQTKTRTQTSQHTLQPAYLAASDQPHGCSHTACVST